MSKIGAWVLGMQEDAKDMTREEFSVGLTD